MATRRRRSVAHRPARVPLSRQLARAAASPAAKAAYVTVGAVGLTALGIAILGPKRFQREIVQPASRAVTSQADRVWAESQDLRDQLSSLIARAGGNREKLVRNFQSWIGHFHAT